MEPSVAPLARRLYVELRIGVREYSSQPSTSGARCRMSGEKCFAPFRDLRSRPRTSRGFMASPINSD